MPTFESIAHTLREIHSRDRIGFLKSLPPRVRSRSILSLLLDGRTIADLAVIDTRIPVLTLVLPTAEYRVVASAFLELGNELWSTGFDQRSGTAMRLERRAKDVLNFLSVATSDGEGLPEADIDLFDCAADRPTCPFALLRLPDLDGSPAHMLKPIPGLGPASAAIPPPPTAA